MKSVELCTNRFYHKCQYLAFTSLIRFACVLIKTHLRGTSCAPRETMNERPRTWRLSNVARVTTPSSLDRAVP